MPRKIQHRVKFKLISKRSLSLNITIIIVLVVTLVSVAFLIFNLLIVSKNGEQQFNQKSSDYLSYLKKNLELPLSNIDRASIFKIGEMMMSNDIISSLVITDKYGDPIFDDRKRDETDFVFRNETVTHQDLVVGTVVLGLTKRFLQKQQQQIVSFGFATILAVAISIAIVVTLSVRFLLNRPLSEFAERIDKIARGDYRQIERLPQYIELIGIMEHIGQMAEKIKSREEALAEINRTITAEIDERTTAEHLLRESEHRYRSLIDNIPVGVFRSKPSGELLNLNLALQIMLDVFDGKKISQMRTDDFYLKPKDRRRMWDDILRDKQVKNFECQLKRSNGDPFWASISARGVEDERGRIKYIDGIVEDIHAKKKVEATQREIQEFRKRIFESSMIPIMIMDPETYAFIDCNPAATSIYKFSSIAETLERTPLDVSAALQYDGTPSLEKLQYYIDKAMKDGMVVFDWKHQHTDGEFWDSEIQLMSFVSEKRQLLQFTIQDITARKRAVDKLQRSEEQHRILVESIPVAIGVTTAEHQIEYINPQFTALFGYQLDDIPSLEIWFQRAYPNPEYRDQVLHLWESALDEAKARHGATRPIEIDVTCKNGSIKTVELIGATAGGKLYGVFQDLTKRQQMEEALRLSLEKYRKTFWAAPIWVVLSSLENGRYQEVNEAFLKTMGYKMEEVIQKTSLELNAWVNPRDREHIVAQVKKKGGIRNFEVQRKTRTGEILDTLFSAEKFQLGGEQMIISVSQDISERKQAEEALRQSEANYRSIFNSANDAVFIHEMETGKILDVNQKMCDMYGYSFEAVGQLSVEDLSSGISPYTQKEARKWITKAAAGEPQLFEWMAKDSRGNLFWVEVNLKCATIEGQDRLLAAVRDITKRKQTEEELRAYREHLEELVEERTSQLESEIEVRRKAEQQIAGSLAEKELLLREIHHRVKNNLNTISNLLYLQSRTVNNRRIEGAFLESRNRIQTMARIHELLYRSESLAQIDMNSYLKKLATELSESYPNPSVTLEIDVSGAKLEIDHAIPCGLIVTELVSNSLKYAFANSSNQDRITVHLTSEDDNYKLVVSDNGCGFPDGLSIDAADSLGLRLVGMLTRQLHGTCEIQSALGKGTRIAVSFSVAEAKEEA